MKAQKARPKRKVKFYPRDLMVLAAMGDQLRDLGHYIWLMANGIDLPSRHRRRRKPAA